MGRILPERAFSKQFSSNSMIGAAAASSLRWSQPAASVATFAANASDMSAGRRTAEQRTREYSWISTAITSRVDARAAETVPEPAKRSQVGLRLGSTVSSAFINGATMRNLLPR